MQDNLFEQRLSQAREWEKKVAAWAARRGWYVLPSYDYSGKGDSKAPKLLAPPGGRDLILPDLACFRGHGLRWLEVKWKRKADLYRKTRTMVTGISLRLWNHYREIEQRVGGEVFVVFLHEQEREVRGDKLSALRGYVDHTDPSDKMSRGGMIFWPYERIPKWGSLEMLDGRDAFEERAAIREYDGGQTRRTAEIEAYADIKRDGMSLRGTV